MALSNQAVETRMSETDDKALVAQILSSYLANNTVAATDLPSVMESVKRAFSGGAASVPAPSAGAEAQKWSPAVPIKSRFRPKRSPAYVAAKNSNLSSGTCRRRISSHPKRIEPLLI
jgi:hypothetical protein